MHSDDTESGSRGVSIRFCHNCGIKLYGKYCAACGQKDLPLNVKLHDFAHELTHEMLHVDGRLFQSIRRLLFWPGFLTREYVEGHRARWISPIRLYLIFSVAYFALAAMTGFQGVGVNERPPRSGWSYSLGTSRPTAAPNNADDDDARQLGFENAEAMRDAANRVLLSWVPRIMFVLMPLFALYVALAYRHVDRNYLHHLIFAVHVHAMWFAVQTGAKAAELADPRAGQVLEALATVFAVVYVVLAFRRVYGKVRFASVRIATVLMAYFVTFVTAFVMIVVPVVFRQLFNRPS